MASPDREDVVEPDATLTCPHYPSQAAKVVNVTTASDTTGTLVTLELSGGMGRALTAPPGTTPVHGDAVTYTTLRDDFQPAPQFPTREETPWTHGGPPLPYVPADEDATEDWS